MQFIIAQSTYSDIQVGLFNNSDIISQKTISKFSVCKQLIPSIQELLNQAKINFSDLAFMGVNQGPAPFNTLRVLISTINGIAYAAKVPVIGVNGIKALYASSRSPQTVVFLNAFNNEVYYAYKKQATLVIGVARITDILQSILLDLPHGAITFIGNGAQLCKEHIELAFGSRARISSTIPSEVSLSTLAEICLSKLSQGEQLQEAQPLYLKRAI